MTSACVGACIVSAWFALRVRASLFSSVDSLRARVESAERTCADAAGAALAVADSFASSSSVVVSNGVPTASPRILGHGVTRSPTRRYFYRDIQFPDGLVERQYAPGPSLKDEKKVLDFLNSANFSNLESPEI